MTESGYPMKFKHWKRGKKLEDASDLYEGETSDVLAFAYRVYERQGYVYDVQGRNPTFFTSEWYVHIVEAPDGMEIPDNRFQLLKVPEDSDVDTFADQILLTLKSDYTTTQGSVLKKGALAATNFAQLLSGGTVSWTLLFEPKEGRSLEGLVKTQTTIVLTILDAVKSQIEVWKYEGLDSWKRMDPNEPEGPRIITYSITAYEPLHSDSIWVTETGFLEPPTLSYTPATNMDEKKIMKQMPAIFETSGLKHSQDWAESEDGTRIPYFVVKREDDGKDRPTILYAYGGFEVSVLPYYSATRGKAWLERGGVLVVANIRGGGEFGPDWHKQAQRENKHKSYEDMAAVAQKLIDDHITSSDKLAAWGGSNGGLLVGNMLVQRPELFGAVVCDVPLLDMRRYSHLLAGASWIGEYGDPDKPTDWEYMQHFSPYHLVDPGKTYPPVLFTTSTRDDRVHPAHARKMALKLQTEVPTSRGRTFLYENTEGGHTGTTPQQIGFMLVLKYEFLSQVLGLDRDHFKDTTDSPPESPCVPTTTSTTLATSTTTTTPEPSGFLTPLVIALAVVSVACLAGIAFLANVWGRREAAPQPTQPATGTGSYVPPQVEMT